MNENENKAVAQSAEQIATGGLVIPPISLGEFKIPPQIEFKAQTPEAKKSIAPSAGEIKIPPQIEFKAQTPEPKKSIAPSAGEMVEHAFNEAVVATVRNDEKIQGELLEGAEKVIHNKTSEIKARAEMEEKEAHFNNKKGACECFGYNETTTEKWAVSVMGIWHNIITAIWLVLGMFTFAPITFVAKKLSVIIKNTWLAVAVAVAIYGIFALSPLWIGLIAKIGGGAA